MADTVAVFVEREDEKFLRGWVSSEEILQQVIEAHSIRKHRMTTCFRVNIALSINSKIRKTTFWRSCSIERVFNVPTAI